MFEKCNSYFRAPKFVLLAIWWKLFVRLVAQLTFDPIRYISEQNTAFEIVLIMTSLRAFSRTTSLALQTSRVANISVSSAALNPERFGSNDGSSGWKWDKNGIGMGGKDQGTYILLKTNPKSYHCI